MTPTEFISYYEVLKDISTALTSRLQIVPNTTAIKAARNPATHRIETIVAWEVDINGMTVPVFAPLLEA